MKHLFLFTLACGATNLFGQHIASSSLSVMRNARALSSSNLVLKNYKFEEAGFWEVNRRPSDAGDPSFAGAAVLGLFPAAATLAISFWPSLVEPRFLFAAPVVWGLSTLMAYQNGKQYERVLDKHHELACLATELMEDTFNHTFIKRILPLQSSSTLKQDFERYVEQKGLSQEAAYKEVEGFYKNFAAVFTDRRYILDESSYKETFDKVKAIRDDLALVLAKIAPENELYNQRKLKYAYMHTPEHVTNRVQSCD